METITDPTSTAAVAVTVKPALNPQTLAIVAGVALAGAAVASGVYLWKKRKNGLPTNADTVVE